MTGQTRKYIIFVAMKRKEKRKSPFIQFLKDRISRLFILYKKNLTYSLAAQKEEAYIKLLIEFL